MKTFAAVLCALLASAGTALAHTTATGGPVVSPVSTSIGSSTSGIPVVTPVTYPVPDQVPSMQADRRHKYQVTPANLGFFDPKVCRPPVDIFTPFEVYVRAEQPPVCGLANMVIAQSAPAAFGPVPLWLPPAFMW